MSIIVIFNFYQCSSLTMVYNEKNIFHKSNDTNEVKTLLDSIIR